VSGRCPVGAPTCQPICPPRPAPPADEEEGFKAALNIGTSVARIGFWGAAGGRLWCTSGTESLHLWDWAAACDESTEGELDLPAGQPASHCELPGGRRALQTDSRPPAACCVCRSHPPPAPSKSPHPLCCSALPAAEGAGSVDVLAAREQLAEAAARSPAGLQLAEGVDYLAGCHYSPASDRLWVLGGSNAGALGVFPASLAAGACSFGAADAVLAGGHEDVSARRLPDLRRPPKPRQRRTGSAAGYAAPRGGRPPVPATGRCPRVRAGGAGGRVAGGQHVRDGRGGL
jgi:hypothetical protein